MMARLKFSLMSVTSWPSSAGRMLIYGVPSESSTGEDARFLRELRAKPIFQTDNLSVTRLNPAAAKRLARESREKGFQLLPVSMTAGERLRRPGSAMLAYRCCCRRDYVNRNVGRFLGWSWQNVGRHGSGCRKIASRRWEPTEPQTYGSNGRVLEGWT